MTETITKISEEEIEVTNERKIKIRKDVLLAQKARIETLLAAFN